MSKRIGVLTTFRDFDTAYSLVSVVRDQLVMHVRHKYEVVLYVLPTFTDDDKVPEGVEIRKVVPQLLLESYKGLDFPSTWQEDAKEVTDALKEHCRDLDIILTHDWIFIDTYLPYNIGLREAQLPAKHFHWIHSAPSPRPELVDNPHANRYTMFPNAKLVYLNHDKTIALAEMYGTWPKDVRVVHNSRDPRTYWGLSKGILHLVDKYDLLNADIVSVYPVSTPRMVDGKQVDIVIKIHAELNKLGLSTRLVVPNAHANADQEKHTVEQMRELGRSMGLADTQLLFTSTEGYEHGLPGNMVSELFRLSNVFIFPSTSENCSLILLEAMIAGNLLVLNKDCTGMQEFGGKNAMYFKFGNLENGIRNYEKALNKPNYLGEIARIIKSEYDQNKVLNSQREAFKKYNLDNIFKQIETLYYEI